MRKKEEKIKRAQEKAKRESDVFHCMKRIQAFMKSKSYPEDIFWSAINKLRDVRATKRKARKEIADAEAKLKNLKKQYGDLL